LRTELYATKLVADGLRAQLAAARLSSSRSVHWGVVAAILAVLLLGRSTHVMNAACSPVAPGSWLLPDQTATFEAPWWAPTGTKATAFSLMCGESRVRSRLVWKGDKLTVYDASSSSSILFQGRAAAGIQVNASKIRLQGINRKGEVEEIPAPWAA
jgi:hypothetical protein